VSLNPSVTGIIIGLSVVINRGLLEKPFPYRVAKHERSADCHIAHIPAKVG
jgi:hypothetical protein